MAIIPSHLRLHTRYRPGDVLLTVANGPLPPPQLLVKSTGLPAYTDSLSAKQGLAAAGIPLPIGRYTTKSLTRVGLHDQDDLAAGAATWYRAAGYQIVELPSGELRVLDPTTLIPLPASPLQLAQSPIAPMQKSMGGDWMLVVRQHHLKMKHGHPDPDKLSEAEMDVWHAKSHATHGERLQHTHGRGILRIRG